MNPKPGLIFSAPIIAGSGAKKKQNCSVELLGLAIYGDYRHGFRLPCIDPAAQALVVAVQDRLSEEARNSRRWRLLIARLATCHNTGSDRVARRMALWAARRVEHLSPDDKVKACNDTVERFLAGDASVDELRRAWKAAVDATEATAATAAWAATATTATAATAVAAAEAAWAAAEAWAATEATDNARMELVDDYLTAWLKVAADEGCLIPDEADAEYAAFLAALDFMETAQGCGS